MMEKRRDKACVDERAVETGSLRLSYRVSRIFFRSRTGLDCNRPKLVDIARRSYVAARVELTTLELEERQGEGGGVGLLPP